MRMSTLRARPRIRQRKPAEHTDPSVIEARIATEHELSELSAYLDNVHARDRVAQGLWAQTWE